MSLDVHRPQLGDAGIYKAQADATNNIIPEQAGCAAVWQRHADGYGDVLPCAEQGGGEAEDGEAAEVALSTVRVPAMRTEDKPGRPAAD